MSKRLFHGLMLGCAAASLMAFAPEGGGMGSGQDRSDDIRKALEKLDVKSDDDWTAGGLPEVARMKELTQWDDLSRQEIALASPGFSRDNAKLKDAKKADEGKGADAPDAPNEVEQARINSQPNTPAEENPNVGKTQLDPYEGQAHTADQAQNREAAAYTKEMPDAAQIAEHIKDPILLIEAACLAAGDPRYLRNGALRQIINHYQIDQVAIKSHQERLDQRQERRDENVAAAEAKSNG